MFKKPVLQRKKEIYFALSSLSPLRICCHMSLLFYTYNNLKKKKTLNIYFKINLATIHIYY